MWDSVRRLHVEVLSASQRHESNAVSATRPFPLYAHPARRHCSAPRLGITHRRRTYTRLLGPTATHSLPALLLPLSQVRIAAAKLAEHSVLLLTAEAAPCVPGG
jgi:hypothetical protein